MRSECGSGFPASFPVPASRTWAVAPENVMKCRPCGSKAADIEDKAESLRARSKIVFPLLASQILAVLPDVVNTRSPLGLNVAELTSLRCASEIAGAGRVPAHMRNSPEELA